MASPTFEVSASPWSQAESSNGRRLSLDFSDQEDDEEIEQSEEHTGDYSTRMEELLDDDEGSEGQGDGEDSDDGGFLYTGVDAETSGYRDQLKDVLDSEAGDDSDEMEAQDVQSPDISQDVEISSVADAEPLHTDVFSDHTPSSSSLPSVTPPRVDSPLNSASSRLARPFLHPAVSRLRSFTPQSSRMASTSSIGTLNSLPPDMTSPSPSHFSAMSRMSSLSNLHTLSSGDQPDVGSSRPAAHNREVFRWTELRLIGHHIYPQGKANKASSVLGVSPLGSPTVLAANGLICVGTDQGKICVYDFKQNLKCICGDVESAKAIGPVTALALSLDHTYVASGHSSGHIQLYDLKTPQTPVRSVPPTTLEAVSSGRKEGHIRGSKIVSIGFVAGRHTAIVSADEQGLAFYHSLGKILFVEASDILRILGKYDVDPPSPTTPRALSTFKFPPPQNISSAASGPSSQRRRKSRYTILAMAPLPLGTTPHPTDPYNVIALLTPTKLVVVALKPTPKTWFKCTRDLDDEPEESRSKHRWTGTLSWYPSVIPTTEKAAAVPNGNDHTSTPTTPMLAFTWGHSMRLIRVDESKVKQSARNTRTGKTSEVEVGAIGFESVVKWSAEDPILAVEWLNANQVVVLTSSTLEVYDAHLAKSVERVQFDSLSLVSPFPSDALDVALTARKVAHSLRVYKGKIFVLGREHFQVGTLLTWADRILSFVQAGDFLNAIDTTRSYYVGDFTGNSNGLPEDQDLRKEVVGQKLRDLMVASARYAFSEDRMTDETHITPDGRGVDRTSLFEGLVATCCRACVALNDFEFLFEDLFQQYADAGISRIYLLQLEHFVLENEVRHVPPRITQRLVALHAADDRPELVERIIWHMDPACLDLNQAINLCQAHNLYDALIYVYTRALRDYVAPVVQLLELIRKVQQYRRSKMYSPDMWTGVEDATMEPIILNAYKVYPYLANTLSGLTYPSEEPLPDEEAFQAKKDVYSFLFFGRSSVWPIGGEERKLVLTADEEGGVEPTYPYARLLLRFDSESFLHCLDIAFEDAYLNDESQGVSRLVIVRILLEIMSSGDLPPADITFVNIFIARNVPKYPQFLHITPSDLHNILIGLAEDPDTNTREDRQLAAEYLLSVYNPHESERIVHLFRNAKFFRILRTWHRQDRKWAPLLSTYLDDTELRPSEVFQSVDDVLTISTRANKGSLPPELIAIIADALPHLLQASIASTAALLNKHMPDMHDQALESLGEDGDHKRFLYLHHLLGPPRLDVDEYFTIPHSGSPSSIPQHLRQAFIALQCLYHPQDVIDVLQYLPPEVLDWDQVIQACESNEVYDAVIWALNWRGDPLEALSKSETFEKRLTQRIADTLSNPATESSRVVELVQRDVQELEAMANTGVSICLERSQGASATEVPLEDLWFGLLSSQINCVQNVSGCCSEEAFWAQPSTIFQDAVLETEWKTLSTLRSLVQTTFSSLVSISSTRTVSFPRLFKRLVNSTTHAQAVNGTQYTEFRTILTGMLESYRSDGDMLLITKHLVDRDLFETVAEATKERSRGWVLAQSNCIVCRKSIFNSATHFTPSNPASGEAGHDQIVVSRTGTIYHEKCSASPLEV